MRKETVCRVPNRRLRSITPSTQPKCAQKVVKDKRFLHANSEEFDKPGWVSKLIRVFARRTDYVDELFHDLAQMFVILSNSAFET